MTEQLKETLEIIFQQCLANTDGQVANYIPQLAKVNPELFGISVCDLTGHRFDIGDTDIQYSIQSCSKPLTYCIARELNGLETVHQHVGFEPSGQAFNAFVLDDQGHPHNPMINAGAIMVSSLIAPEQEPADRFELVRHYLSRMAGKMEKIGFDNGVFL